MKSEQGLYRTFCLRFQAPLEIFTLQAVGLVRDPMSALRVKREKNGNCLRETDILSGRGVMRIRGSITIIGALVAGISTMFAATSALTHGFGSAPTPQSNAQFFAAADQVLQVMSKILDLPVKAPLKKSIRTKAQIRQYLADEQKKGESPRRRYADRRTLEAFGLIPKGFPLDSFLLNLLTDQVAGMYV